MSKAMKIFNIVAWLSILMGSFLIILLTYWFIYPYKVLSFNKGNGTLVEHTVLSGGYLMLRQNSCKYMKLTSVIDRQFIDSIVYQVPTSYNDRGLGCSEKIEYVYVPKTLAPGEYYIRTVITFQVNPIRQIHYTVITDKFTVIKQRE